MFASVLALAAATVAAPADPSARTREAYLNCLTGYVRTSRRENMPPEQFDSGYDATCTAERAAWRDAVIKRELGYRASRAQAEEDAQMELDDAKANFLDLYRWHTENNSVPED